MKSQFHRSGSRARARPTRSRSGVATVMLQHARAALQPLRQFQRELRKAVDAVHVAVDRKAAGFEQHVLGAQARDRVGMRADEHARLGHLAQQRIEPVAPAAVLDGVASHPQRLHAQHLLSYLIGEVISRGTSQVASSPTAAQAPSNGRTPTLKRNSATAAPRQMAADTTSKRPAKPAGQKT